MTRRDASEAGNRSLMNLNGNLLCAVDTETTGLVAGFHDVIEVAVVPLDADLQPMKGILPFEMFLHPKRPQNIAGEAMKVNGIDLAKVQVEGFDPWSGAERFDDWFRNKLCLAQGRKIAPLAMNWPFDSGFLKDWLGPSTFNDLFHYHYRDLGPVGKWMNDRAEFQAEQCPFPKSGLQYMAEKLGMVPERKHRAIDDALLLAKVYRATMFMGIK